MAVGALIITVPITLICLFLTGNTGSIPIGAIFDSRDIISQRAFDFALARHKKQGKQREPYFQFNLTSDSVNISDNFQLASAICRQMSQGVFAILGQKSFQSADIVKSLTSTFHMPYITPSLSPSSLPGVPSSYEIHLRPDLTAAIVDVIEYLGWRQVHFMYDSDEGLHRLQHLHKMMRNNSVQWFSMVRFTNVEDVHDELRIADDTDSLNFLSKAFVLDLSSEDAYSKVLKQIPEVGMNKFGYNYLLATLDFQSLNLSRFRHGGVNVTGFQLLETSSDSAEDLLKDIRKVKVDEKRKSSHGLPVHAALTVDGLRVIESTISAMLKNDSDVFRWIFRRGELYNLNKTKGIPCTTKPPAPWMFGPRLLETIKQGRSEGLSGTLTFTEDGYRKDFTLGVYSMALDRGLQKIGTWSPRSRFISIFAKPYVDLFEDPRERKDLNSTLIITSILTPPFLMKKERKDGEPILMGNDGFEGYSMDLAKELAKEVGFTFTFRLVADENYGTRYPNNTWNGIMGELISGVADLAVAPLTITADRERYVDFSKHFMDIGVTIMIKKPASVRPGVFSFMEPLSLEVWICIILAYITVSVGLFLVTRFSPVEWRKIKIGEFTYHNEFSLVNSFWFSMGALMFQGSDNCPRSVSGRVIGGAWWFFVLISISSYTANLAAFLTIERMITPIESADDLVNHPTIKYGAVASGSTKQFFVNSDVSVYRQMGDYMESHPEVLVHTNEEGIERVLKSKGKYAFLAESPLVEYVSNRKPCDTTSVGGMLNNKGFGIATPRNSPIRDPINVAVLKLKEEGKLYNLHQTWWVEKGQCGGTHSSKKGKMSLSLSNLAGIFYILIVGLVIAISLGVIEFVCFRTKFKAKDTITGEGYMRGTSTFSTLCNSPTKKPSKTTDPTSRHDPLLKKTQEALMACSTENLSQSPAHDRQKPS